MEEQSRAFEVERDRTRGLAAVLDVREGCTMRTRSLPSRLGGVVWKSLELGQTQPLNKLPSPTVVLALSNDRMFEMKNGSFTGLNLHKTPPWSVPVLEAVLVCGQALTGGDADVHPAMLPQSVSCRSLAHADAANHVDVPGPYWCQKPRGSLGFLFLLTVKDKEVTFVVVSMTADTQLRNRQYKVDQKV